jgi:hypothetical protein
MENRVLAPVMVLLVGFFSSVSQPMDDAERWRRYDLVRVTVNTDQVRGCKSLGLVEPPSFVPVDPQQRGHDRSHREEKWGTMEAGGDTVLLTAAGAEAYRCAAPKRTKKASRARTPKPRP